MISISASQMREWERAAEKRGISSSVLMENAGKAAACFVISQYPEAKSITVVCGKGNNAGDGFVCARYLLEQRRQVRVLMLCSPEALSADARSNFEKVHSLVTSEMGQPDLIVDAILGTGVTRSVSGVFQSAIAQINLSGKTVVSLDVPSGIQADSGDVMGCAVRANRTLTFGAVKRGLLSGDGVRYAGMVTVLEIGLPQSFLKTL